MKGLNAVFFTTDTIAGAFMSYLVIAIVLAAIAVGGIFVGKALRKRKDAKKQQEEA